MLKVSRQDYFFHDFKISGVTPKQAESWLKKIPAEKLLNKKSTTWRGLSNEEQQTAITNEGIVVLLVKYNSLIKRPLIEWKDGSITVGFDEASIKMKISS